jgi:hypothetical protein
MKMIIISEITSECQLFLIIYELINIKIWIVNCNWFAVFISKDSNHNEKRPN